MKLKKLALTSVVVLLVLGTNAQTSGSNSTNGTTHTSEGNHAAKKNKKKKGNLNHRRNYNWKSGQQATPTGQEATGVGSGYSSIKKDTAGKRED